MDSCFASSSQKYTKVIILHKTIILECCSSTVMIIVKFSNSYMYKLLGIHLSFYSFVTSSNIDSLNAFQH